MRGKLQTLGKAMLMPLAVIAVAGLFMGLGGALTAMNTVKSIGLDGVIYPGSFLYNMFSIMKAMGDLIFKNLPILYAAGVAFGMAKREQGWAAFSGVVAYIAMNAIISTMFNLNGVTPDTASKSYFIDKGMDLILATKWNSLYTTDLGYFTYRMGIFGGLIAGLTVQAIHNKFYNAKLPIYLSFFAGTRTVPILSLVAGTGLGVFMYYLWPTFGLALASLAEFIAKTGLFGTFTWAILDKSLIPLGLHHLITTPMRWTELGGTALVDGQLVSGTTAIHMAQLGAQETTKLAVRGFASGRAILHLGALPGAALAMYHTSKPENKAKMAGILVPAVATMILFGITEPIEFTFLFVAPWLFYLVHVPLTGLSFVLGEYFNISIFGSSVKDWLPLILHLEKLYLLPYLFLIPLFFVVYYFLFKTLIVKYNVLTPGREEVEEAKLYSKNDYLDKKSELIKEGDLAVNIVEGLGGPENIEELDNCITRLRVVVADPEKVVEDNIWKNHLKARGVVRKGNALQVIYGSHVTQISGDVKELLDL